ncbi:methionyl-tRNA formyltransferase [endosymbiont of Euscepes postfasciatus]|uniref:methionyl-tRNA formyltransferase n=1 Tax=endosymbiont of Euscepes postfasciatus TaxID=650377 RepID=UPI000DC70B87|nr:formyltransferase family protein [endosymbiont of Euscepes postfasciatus]BBA84667.1 methionyl-tRNA formyltransferase [endosymbiont of Euscepes postfasciatus]
MFLKKNNLKIIFMGSCYFSLNQLFILNKKYIISLIIFKEKINFYKIKEFAIKNKIFFLKIKNFSNEIINIIKNINPDIIIVSSFGLLLNNTILNIPKYGCINIHPSLLPSLKGPAPIYWAIIKNYKYTGISIIKMNDIFDNGNIIFQIKYKIKKHFDYKYLSNKLSNMSGIVLNNILEKIEYYINLKVKNNYIESYARKITKSDALLNFNNNSFLEYKKIKSFNIWPICYFIFNDKKIKIIDSKYRFSKIKFNKKIGNIFFFKKKVFIILKYGLLEIIKIKIQNKKNILYMRNDIFTFFNNLKKKTIF